MKKTAIILCLLMASCADQKAVEEKLFFDLDSFVNDYTKQLTERNPDCVKYVNLNGETEEQKGKNRNWTMDLQLLKEFDINKPSWRTSFHQTTDSTEGLIKLVYTPLDSSVSVKKLFVVFDRSAKVKEIYGERSSVNILYKRGQTFHLYIDSFYSLSNIQKVWLLSDKNYEMRIRLLD